MKRCALFCVVLAFLFFICGCGAATNVSLSVSSDPSPITNYEKVESRIEGTFEGWDGDTLFQLENGQVWQQSSYAYLYHYAYNPNVCIYDDNGEWKMKVEDVDEVITVERLK